MISSFCSSLHGRAAICRYNLTEILQVPLDRTKKQVSTQDRTQFAHVHETKTYEISTDEGDVLAVKSILLVEDESAYAEILKEYLETFNYKVTIASDGVQGLKRVMERDFDLVICDLLMPNLPGDMFYVAVERVKPALAKRFIFITGHQENPKIGDFVKRTKSLTLFKPFEMHVLLETIMAALKTSRRLES